MKMVMEMGVDPGVDHMLAMECFDDIRAQGGKVIELLFDLFYRYIFLLLTKLKCFKKIITPQHFRTGQVVCKKVNGFK